MLILTRKIGETIRIGDDVTVRVLGVRGGQVSLGFVAPGEVRIFREEVLREDRPVADDAGAAARTPLRGERGAVAPRPPAKVRPAAGGTPRVASRSA